VKNLHLNIIIFTFLALFFSTIVVGQQNLDKFNSLYKQGSFNEAAQEIDRLIMGKTDAGSMLYYYKSDVNLILFKNTSPKNYSYLNSASISMSLSLSQKDYTTNKQTIDPLMYTIGKECFIVGAGEYNNGNFKGAQNYFQYTVTFYQTSGKTSELSQIMFYLALSSYYNKDLTVAQKYLQILASQNYNESEVYLLLAEIYRNQNQLQKAIDVLVNTQKLSLKNNDKILRELIFLYIDLKNYDDALEAINLFKTKYNPDYEIIFNEGVIYYQRNMMEPAITAFKKVLTMEPSHFSANYNLGIIYYNNSIAIMKNAEENYYGNPDKYRAEKDKYLENIKISLSYMEKSHAVEGGDMNTVSCLADIYKRLQRMEEYNSMLKMLEK
jgi:tetratricopeptide (TPR) repeat protein